MALTSFEVVTGCAMAGNSLPSCAQNAVPVCSGPPHEAREKLVAATTAKEINRRVHIPSIISDGNPKGTAHVRSY